MFRSRGKALLKITLRKSTRRTEFTKCSISQGYLFGLGGGVYFLAGLFRGTFCPSFRPRKTARAAAFPGKRRSFRRYGFPSPRSNAPKRRCAPNERKEDTTSFSPNP